MTKRELELSKDQAFKTIELCLKNAREFLEESELLFKNNKTAHMPIFLQFTAEELGKSKIVLKKLETSSDKILIRDSDGIFHHITKSNTLENEIDIPIDQKMLLGFVIGDDLLDYLFDPIVIACIEDEKKKLRTLIKEGHKSRLSSSFMDFDNIGNPILGHNISTDNLDLILKALKESLLNIEKEIELLKTKKS